MADQGARTRPVFVYGTLMPGHLRWPLLGPHARAWREAEVPGTLYDTGHGYPAATFREGTTAVPGWLVDLRPGIDADVLRELDEVEGVASGLYDRVVVRATDGTEAWSYTWAGPTDAFTPIARWVDPS
jgi:gamma-glutamylcyclotransferase (GGCT)/AIG2-like uncharacterized protein YtfP